MQPCHALQGMQQEPGCAGATADAFTLFERLEVQLETHSGAALTCVPMQPSRF